MRQTFLITLLVLGLTQNAVAAPCPQTPSAKTAALQDAMAKGRFVSYQPTALRVINGRVQHADAPSIRADL